ncbi:MAG TPA: TIR domain-containing protein [Sphingomicrobium sp.]|nr:TIR domain-containing protein [Sphingomicrobium sp.]
MSDVFVSYARTDEPQAKRVAEALRALGYNVWRDDELPAHRPYSEVIEERLKSAKAVVVIWSAEAARSQWVRAEADAARSAGTIIQALLDGTMPPMPFNQIQCADLKGWDGSTETTGWRKLVASVAALAGTGAASKAPKPRKQISICVLPFANMSGDVEQEYFSDGISEDITTDLSKISALEVIARNTAFTFKGQSVNVCDVAAQLGVTHVLEGSVRKAASRVRITAQLIDGHAGGHLWAERYDRELTDIFEIQDEISAAIVAALKLKLLPQEKKAIENRGTANAEAYNLFLMARQYWIDGDFGESGRERRVIRICKRATEIDPDYAQAWALMGLAQANLRYGSSGNDELDDGLAASNRALDLDPSIAEAHLPRVWYFAMVGDEEQAQAELETALHLNPDSWEVNKEAARVLYRQGKTDGAIRHIEKATQLADSDFHSRGMLSSLCLARGDLERARECAAKLIKQVEAALARNPDNGAAIAYGVLSFAAVGNFDRAREWIERALLLDPDNMYMRYNLAWPVLAFFNDKEQALQLLEPALEKGGKTLVSLAAADANLDALRDDARFQAMLENARARVGSAAEAAVTLAGPVIPPAAT